MSLSQNDLIVIVPGILGSALAHNGKEVWGPSGSGIRGGLSLLSGYSNVLALPEDVGWGDPKDGVVATRLLPKLHLLPSLWGVDGYGRLRKYLFSRFDLTETSKEQPGNYLEFPYDWRLSNVVSANRLKETVEPALERWRRARRDLSGSKEPQIVFICHSMGGLVQVLHREVAGPRSTRRLITIGTPYSGSVNAVDCLANGVKIGPMTISKLSKLTRSFPSVYELLPTYPCIKTAGGMSPLDSIEVPNIHTDRVRAAFAFHSEINEEVAKIGDPSSARTGLGYKIAAIKGQIQPTVLAAELDGEGVKTLEQRDGGDGTVPRISAHPPEWESEDEGQTFYTAGRHATLQNLGDVQIQLHGLLTSGEVKRPMGGTQIGVRLPDSITAGQPLIVDVFTQDEDDTLPLKLALENLEKQTPVPDLGLLKNLNGGHYQATVPDLAAGTYKVSVGSALPLQRPVDTVSDACIVWDPREGV